ncbi:MAG: hypothetical protein AAF628_15560 [Planctomycetota bacterium]
MTDPRWTKEEQDVIADLLTGARAMNDPDVARTLAANPALAEECRVLLEMAQKLDTAGEQQRREVSELMALEPNPEDLATTQAFLRQQRSSRRAFWVVGPLLAAAVLVLGIWIGRQAADDGGGGGDPDVILGTDRELSPSGEVERFETFSWSADELDTGLVFEIIVESDADEPQELARTETEAPTWTPSSEELARINAAGQIRWRVVGWEPDGEQAFSKRARASRR